MSDALTVAPDGTQFSQTQTVVRAEDIAHEAVVDLLRGIQRYDIWYRFALHDVRQRFKRSVLGPLWLTLSLGIMMLTMGIVFSTVFQQNMTQTMPYIAAGLIFWTLLSGCISEGTEVFINNKSYIQNVNIPLSTHLYRMLTKNVITMAFNSVVYLLVLAALHVRPGWQILQFIPGFVLFMLNAAWIALAAGILSTRFRDMPQVILNGLQVVFFVTPVFWSTASLPRKPDFVEWNPLYHLIQIVREPLLGQPVSAVSWICTIGLAIFGTIGTVFLYRRAYPRIAYWV